MNNRCFIGNSWSLIQNPLKKTIYDAPKKNYTKIYNLRIIRRKFYFLV